MSSVNNHCGICGSARHSVLYAGPVRHGTFGNSVPDAQVFLCSDCGVGRLGEKWCVPSDAYTSPEYRAMLAQSVDIAAQHREHDHMQRFILDGLWPKSLRGLTVADIGAASGSLLDHVSGLAKRLIAVEPCEAFHSHLRANNYEVYGDVFAAGEMSPHSVDIAFCSQVIEHVDDPVGLLRGVLSMLKPGGKMVLSTPNTQDILLKLLPDEYKSFYFRSVHRWYFDAPSMQRTFQIAGFKDTQISFTHRYPLANAMLWLRDKRPSGMFAQCPGITQQADGNWQTFLENTGQADCLLAVASAGL